MSFYPRNLHNSGASFHPLFRLLDDYDSYSSEGQNGRNTRSHVQSFQPKFDVRELEDAYELHGELPGINKEDVNIEFSDPHTLYVRGRIVRSYTSGTPPTGLQDTQARGAITEGGEKATRAKDHKATVEDEDTAANPEATSETAVARSPKAEAPADKAKYWVSERSIGEFSRTFNFPGRIQQDAVTAGLKDGILTVRVPKAPKNETRRRVQIN